MSFTLFLFKEVAAGSYAHEEQFTSQSRLHWGKAMAPQIVLENGVKYSVDIAQHAQKTGAYLDQRSNRLRFGEICQKANSKILDLCCYHGGFGLNAKNKCRSTDVTGATHVTFVDASQAALDVVL
jgi:23S rRNA G2069 N7-methylase RlmK/C1962 C5-methylase RlmI